MSSRAVNRKAAAGPRQEARAQEIGGKVHDDAGEPLVGAVVTRYADDPETTEAFAYCDRL